MIIELSRILDGGGFCFFVLFLYFFKAQIPRINETDLEVKVIEPELKRFFYSNQTAKIGFG